MHARLCYDKPGDVLPSFTDLYSIYKQANTKQPHTDAQAFRCTAMSVVCCVTSSQQGGDRQGGAAESVPTRPATRSLLPAHATGRRPCSRSQEHRPGRRCRTGAARRG